MVDRNRRFFRKSVLRLSTLIAIIFLLFPLQSGFCKGAISLITSYPNPIMDPQNLEKAHLAIPILLTIILILLLIIFRILFTRQTWMKKAVKERTAQLLESEKRLRILFDQAADAIFVCDDNGNLTQVNEQACRVLGYSQEELLGLNVIDVDAEITTAEKFQAILKSSPLGSHRTIESYHKRKDGTLYPVEITLSRLETSDGLRMMGIARNISKRKQAEEALRENERKLREAQQMAGLGYWIWDVSSGDVQWSEEVYKIFGLDPDTFKPHIDSILALSPWPEERQRGKELIQKSIETHEGGSYEQRFLRPDGNIGYYFSTYEGIFDKNGDLITLRGTVQDITERKQAEEERLKLQNQLRQAQKLESVGRLAGGVAHDFNNMLNLILGHAELAMANTAPDHPIRHDLEGIQKATRRSSDLTHQLLAFARKQIISPQVLDLNKTVESMLKMLRRLIGEDIDLSWNPSHSLQPVLIDPVQVDQILANLLLNARDAIDHTTGKVTIETSMIDFDQQYCSSHPGFKPGHYVQLTISDNGCGMDAEILEQIFEPFFTSKELGKGTGLGLATVYGIVKQNNGFINVYSEPKLGTTFRIYLPVVEAEKLTIEDKKAINDTRGNETILIVEDEDSLLDVTARMLKSQGYRVLIASTPSDAIRQAQEFTGDIHLLITDVVLPEMNGRELAGQLLSLYPHIKQLFMSGYPANVIAHQGVLAEGVNFLGKPFSQTEMGTKIRMILDDSQ